MSWVVLIYGMLSGACLWLAATHGWIWLRDRRAWAQLALSVMAISVVAAAALELAMMRTESPIAYGGFVRWMQVAGFGVISGSVCFVHFYLGTGRRWLALAVVGCRAISLVPNFTTGVNQNFLRIDSLQKVEFLGEQVSILGSTIPNPWMGLAQAALVLWLAYVIDAAIRLWRLGGTENRRRAWVCGASMAFFILFVGILPAAMFWGLVRMPLVASFSFGALVLMLGYDLSRELARAAEVERRLRSSEQALAGHRSELAHLSRVAAVGGLSGSLAHEINQPLTSILCNAQTVQELLAQGPVDRKAVGEMIDDIVAAEQHAAAVIRRVRSFLKKDEARWQPVAINAVVEEVLRLMRGDLRAQGVRVETQLADALPPVGGDAVQLQQVLLNLTVNACDAMKENAREQRQLAIRTEPTDSAGVCVTLSDSGSGIPLELVEKIFEPFHTTKPHGTGLGLSVCRTIVEAHGGTIEAANDPARGATFRITLPSAGNPA